MNGKETRREMRRQLVTYLLSSAKEWTQASQIVDAAKVLEAYIYEGEEEGLRVRDVVIPNNWTEID